MREILACCLNLVFFLLALTALFGYEGFRITAPRVLLAAAETAVIAKVRFTDD